MFDEKVLLITGGTGSFGNAVLQRFLSSDLREIRIFSRDLVVMRKNKMTCGTGIEIRSFGS
jgi:FlaA1/EpsC-like NDP-sugar epimerase